MIPRGWERRQNLAEFVCCQSSYIYGWMTGVTFVKILGQQKRLNMNAEDEQHERFSFYQNDPINLTSSPHAKMTTVEFSTSVD